VSSRIGRAIATFLNFYVSHGSATRFLRNGERCYIYLIDNLLLFPTVKELSKLVNSWWSYCKKFNTTFFLRQGVLQHIHTLSVTVLFTVSRVNHLVAEEKSEICILLLLRENFIAPPLVAFLRTFVELLWKKLFCRGYKSYSRIVNHTVWFIDNFLLYKYQLDVVTNRFLTKMFKTYIIPVILQCPEHLALLYLAFNSPAVGRNFWPNSNVVTRYS